MSIHTKDHPRVNTSVPRRTSTTDTPDPSPHFDPGLLNNGENHDDAAENVQITVPGWPTLATLMADKPDLQAFSSFADLNVKSLLYYQAELIHLRKQLHKAEWNDHRQSDRNDPAANYAEDLESLFMMVADPDEKTPEQWTIMCKIREVLDKYSKFSLKYSCNMLIKSCIKTMRFYNSHKCRHLGIQIVLMCRVCDIVWDG
jgi:hypothetical protein